MTLTELGTAAKAWIGDERLGSWPKVRLRVSEIVICELERIEMREAGCVS